MRTGFVTIFHDYECLGHCYWSDAFASFHMKASNAFIKGEKTLNLQDNL